MTAYDAIGGRSSGGSRAPLRIFVVAGEHSGDALGGKLMAALNAQLIESSIPVPVYAGLGGEAMTQRGLTSLFPLHDVIVMGPVAIARAYPRLRRRAFEVIDAAIAFAPDAVVIIDAPEFTHPIAKRIRKRMPGVPVIDYVSPSVWAWRPGRSARMRGYIDHVLALLPFEPGVHQRLGGPPCTYVGHPLIERSAWIEAQDPHVLTQRLGLPSGQPVLVVLPGSRASEVRRLLQPFGEAVALLHQTEQPFLVLIPTVASVRGLIEAQTAQWPVRPVLLEGEADKFAAFRLARAALAVSGTVTLELALAGTPMVVAYKVEPLATLLRFLVKVQSIVLANLVLGENAFPELIQEDCTPRKLADTLLPLLHDTPERRAQLAALARIKPSMGVQADGSLREAPSRAAARIVLETVQGFTRRSA
jgi:lipid-A-disaccharide synthase